MKAISDNLFSLPEKPGIYKFLDAQGKIIYVGKAKNIKKRVSNYFTSNNGKDNKTLRLVKQIKDIQFSVVSSEKEALLLENNLIKENQPKYNILLKDGKTYPYLLIKNEPFPRIITTRTKNKNDGEYFGPFPSVSTQKNALELINKMFQFRTCNLNLTEKNIDQGKFKECLEFHIGNCKAPCIGKQNETSYLQDINLAKDILKGRIKIVQDHFQNLIQIHSDKLEFEKAHNYQSKLEKLKTYHSKSLVSNNSESSFHVVTIIHGLKKPYANYLYIHQGNILKTRNFEIKNPLKNTDQELLGTIIDNIITFNSEQNHEILSNINVHDSENNYFIKTPKTGDKKRILNLSIKNAIAFKESIEKIETPDANLRKIQLLRSELKLSQVPYHIECFDNSNFQGTDPVASMVCFKKGKPSKKDYRHYNIKTVEGPDDFASMKEVVLRRYKRLIAESAPLPNLIVIDGGKGQLHAAYEIIKDLNLDLDIIGIAKRLEEIYKPNDQYPIMISKKSESLRIIQHIRNESHRFAINFHREKRSLRTIDSDLNKIEGIGPKTIQLLLKELKSLQGIQNAKQEHLERIIGPKRADLVLNYLKKKRN